MEDRQTINITQLVDEQRINHFGLAIILISFFVHVFRRVCPCRRGLCRALDRPAVALKPRRDGPRVQRQPFRHAVRCAHPRLSWRSFRQKRGHNFRLPAVRDFLAGHRGIAYSSSTDRAALSFGIGWAVCRRTPSRSMPSLPQARPRHDDRLHVHGHHRRRHSPRRSQRLLAKVRVAGIVFHRRRISSIAVALVAFFFCPNRSSFWCCTTPAKKVAQLAKKLRPGISIAPRCNFLIDEKPRSGFSIRLIFADGRAWMTPLLWIVFFSNLMANFFLNSWMPTLFQDLSLSVRQSALTMTLFYFGGIAGGITISRLLDKRGLAAIGLTFLLGCPFVAAIGTPGLSHNFPGWSPSFLPDSASWAISLA